MIYDILVGLVAFCVWALVINTAITWVPKFHKYRVRIRRCTIDGVPYWCVETKPTLLFWVNWHSYNHFEDYHTAHLSYLRLKRVLP